MDPENEAAVEDPQNVVSAGMATFLYQASWRTGNECSHNTDSFILIPWGRHIMQRLILVSGSPLLFIVNPVALGISWSVVSWRLAL